MRNMKRVNFSWKYAVLIVGLVVIGYLVMNFNNRIANLRRLTIQRDAVRRSPGGLGEHQRHPADLRSPAPPPEAAAIEWAYQEGNIGAPGRQPGGAGAAGRQHAARPRPRLPCPARR